MKVIIEDDVFDILKRVREIDEGYFILFDTSNCKYELHNINQPTTYCLTIPFDNIDSRLIDLVLYTNISNIDNIINDIDTNNNKIEFDNKNNLKNQTDYMVREIYNFCNNSSKELTDNSFNILWR